MINNTPFRVCVVGLQHAHGKDIAKLLFDNGADIVSVYDRDSEKVEAFKKIYPDVKILDSEEEALKEECEMYVLAGVPSERAPFGIKALYSGKNVISDKPSVTNYKDLEALKKATKESGKRYFTYFGERLRVEASLYAEEIIKSGKIGRVVSIMGWGPHRLGDETKRPMWIWDPKTAGGVITDLASHQIEQLFFYSGAKTGKVVSSRTANYSHKEHPLFEDFGDGTILFDNGVTGYFRVDWLTPKGLSTWGDGRTIILGTKGYIELRKYVDVAKSSDKNNVYWVDEEGEHYQNATGLTGYPFFKKMIDDCTHNTDTAMNQDYIFKVLELTLDAQSKAIKVE